MENKFCFAAYNILMPYPNTPFYTRLEREGRSINTQTPGPLVDVH
jgi:hypothetical protein